MPTKNHRIGNCRWFLAALMLAGFALRIYRIDAQSLWYDEGFSIALARSSLVDSIAWTAQDVHPPLYYHLLHFWIRLCGDSALATRLFSLLVSVASILLFYLLARRAMNGTAGLAAALLATVSPFCIYYAQETRMYALVTLLSMFSCYFLLRATDETIQPKQRRYLWAGVVVTDVAAAYTHYFSLFVMIFQTVCCLFFAGWSSVLALTADAERATMRSHRPAGISRVTIGPPWGASVACSGSKGRGRGDK